MSEQLKNSIAYEANLYIATYAQVAENNMAKAKEHYEKHTQPSLTTNSANLSTLSSNNFWSIQY